MPKSESSLSTGSPSKSRRTKPKGAALQRVDPPHALPSDASEAVQPEKMSLQSKPLPPNSLQESASQGELLQAHAEQISIFLAQRQKELDHREAELNSRAAELESETRAARLWLAERDSDLTARSTKLAEQQEQLAKQFPSGPSDSKDTTFRRNPTSDSADSLEMQRRQLEEAESRVGIALSDIERIQEELLAERRIFQEEVVTTRREFADAQRQAAEELERKRQAVQRQSEHVDHCRMALEQLRTELERAQRETLEVRLATEELWVQLSGSTPPATITRSLGRIRTRLADSYSQANAELVERKKELEAMRGQLAEQCAKLVEQKRCFEQWYASLQEQAEEQASRLVAREEQLHHEEVRLQEESHGWRSERVKYQQEIRRLRTELASKERAAFTS